jgi:peptidoglycan/LPS O-acetylase OafA/YrhL
MVEESEKTLENSQPRTLTYRAELDGLRAIAVLSVLCYHAKFSLFKGGYVGVDVFFVLSGFLMSSIIYREMEENKFTLRAFYERRARRILPMLIFTLFVSYVPAYIFMADKNFVFFTKSALFSSVAVSNIFYSQTTKGYFDTSTDFIPLVHTWTLGVEEQFYVIIPLIFILVWPFGKHYVCGVIAILAIGSFYLTFLSLSSIQKFYMLHTRYMFFFFSSLLLI